MLNEQQNSNGVPRNEKKNNIFEKQTPVFRTSKTKINIPLHTFAHCTDKWPQKELEH